MTNSNVVTFTVRGAHRELFAARDSEILSEGPAGTGKTRANLELVNLLCHTYAGLRILMLRKTQVSMAASVLAEFQQHVLKPGDRVSFVGHSPNRPASFRYGNGSEIIVGGLDDPEKFLSSFFDIVYINEVTECTQDDLEMISTRIRAPEAGMEPKRQDGKAFEHRRILMDCNPTYASHWLMQRTETIPQGATEPLTRLIRSVLEDNPAYYDDHGIPTTGGLAYIARLDRLTGQRYERFRLGRRVGVQDACYAAFDRDIHVRPLEPGLYFQTTIVGVDYGTKHECAVVVVSFDQFNRRWIREVWYEADTSQGKNLRRQIGLVKERYKSNRGRTDPNQSFLAGVSGYNVAKGAPGSRLHRIDIAEPLFYTYPGGRVPSMKDELNLTVPQGPFTEDDSPGILLVEGAPGIDRLASELEAYHYIWTETTKGRTKDVYRVDENGIAAFEYANEEFDESSDFIDPEMLLPSVREITYKPQHVVDQFWSPQKPRSNGNSQVITYRSR